MRRLLPFLTCLMLACTSAQADDAPLVLVIVGPSNHPPGSHEVAAGGRLIAHCLQQLETGPSLRAQVVYEWPSEPLLREASTIVFTGDNFPPNRMPNPLRNLAQLSAQMERGCGIVCIHYATGLLGEDVGPDGDHPLLRWAGGYFAHRSCPHHESIAKIFPSTITPATSDHPINRGWSEFSFRDEPYYNNYFGKNNNQPAPNVTPLAFSMLPPQAPKKEIVAWCVQREDEGRGFSIVMPHFYKSWAQEDLRRFILNGIVWTAGLEVPEGGTQTTLPDLATFEPDSVEFVPRKK